MQEFAESEDAILGFDDEDKDPAIVVANVDTVGTNTVLPTIVAANTTIPDAAVDVTEENVDLLFQDFEKENPIDEEEDNSSDNGEIYRPQWYEFTDDESDHPGD
ncbi:hypothetical protein V6N13_014282 [Hibiscus sabdariffa]|uniref:Uncharacterized protein n=1 Tax=Hibiscus sabdariffa TaxID=183260 RepID=A0ABR2RVA9_9ROSI